MSVGVPRASVARGDSIAHPKRIFIIILIRHCSLLSFIFTNRLRIDEVRSVALPATRALLLPNDARKRDVRAYGVSRPGGAPP